MNDVGKVSVYKECQGFVFTLWMFSCLQGANGTGPCAQGRYLYLDSVSLCRLCPPSKYGHLWVSWEAGERGRVQATLGCSVLVDIGV